MVGHSLANRSFSEFFESFTAKGWIVVKIFYSWRMNAPRKTNKDFIHAALSQAVSKLTDQLDVSEAERGDIKVDQDTQGILGSPDIVRVILEKIVSSTVVVADVSLVAAGKDNKKHINSNVAIELGSLQRDYPNAIRSILRTAGIWREPYSGDGDLRCFRNALGDRFTILG